MKTAHILQITASILQSSLFIWQFPTSHYFTLFNQKIGLVCDSLSDNFRNTEENNIFLGGNNTYITLSLITDGSIVYFANDWLQRFTKTIQNCVGTIFPLF